tara:strand:- start:4513 stop:4968 length:456 start_codon:yes stop_codon:yes gene_type:complete
LYLADNSILQAVDATSRLIAANEWGLLFVGVAVTLVVLKSVFQVVVWGVGVWREFNQTKIPPTDFKIRGKVTDIHEVVVREDPALPGHKLVWGLRPELAERLITALEESRSTNQAVLAILDGVRGSIEELGTRIKGVEKEVERLADNREAR